MVSFPLPPAQFPFHTIARVITFKILIHIIQKLSITTIILKNKGIYKDPYLHLHSRSSSVHFAPATLASLLFPNTLNIFLMAFAPSDFSAWVFLPLGIQITPIFLASAQMSSSQEDLPTLPYIKQLPTAHTLLKIPTRYFYSVSFFFIALTSF